MSKENVEIVRRMYEAHNRDGPDGAEEYWASEIEMFDAPEFPDATRQVGATEVREMLSNYMAVGWDGRFEVEEYIDAGREVIVAWRMNSTGPGSGLPGSFIFFHVCQLENCKVRRLRQFLSRSQALEAAGLEE